jgi:hypothetical protein
MEDKEFLAQVGRARSSFAGEVVGFLRTQKKWWLAPIVLSIVVLGMLVILGGTGVAPFIYTLF